jgi:Protein of unknown function (DUF732)
MRANDKPRRVLVALQALAVAIGLAISTAPATHADQHDDAFLLALKRNGVVAFGDPGAVLAWAHLVCDQLAQGAEGNISGLARSAQRIQFRACCRRHISS